MKEDRHSGHAVTRPTARLVRATKYRYHVLEGDIKVRCLLALYNRHVA